MFWPFRKRVPSSASPISRDRWPSFVDGKRPLTCWTKPDKSLRVFMLLNEDGTFSQWSEYFSADPYEMCWIQCMPGASFYDCEETALREIHAQYPWSKDVTATRNPVK